MKFTDIEINIQDFIRDAKERGLLVGEEGDAWAWHMACQMMRKAEVFIIREILATALKNGANQDVVHVEQIGEVASKYELEI